MSEKDFHLDSPFPSPAEAAGDEYCRAARPEFDPADLRHGELLSSLAHKIGHEIGNPLTSIISLATIVERFSNADDQSQSLSPEKVANYSRSIVSEAWRISALNERMVSLLSIKTGHASDVEIARVIEAALKRISTRKQLDCSDVIIRFEKDAPQTARIDSDHLLLVIEELVGNALQSIAYSASGDSENAFPPPVVLSIAAGETGVRIEVSNPITQPFSGELHSVFEPFVGEHADQKHIGIGLPMVVGILQRTDARGTSRPSIEVQERSDGKGLQFVATVNLPTAATETIEDEEQDSEAAMESAKTTFRLLVVDDETVVSSAIKKILEVTLSTDTRSISCDCLSGSQAISIIDAGEEFDVLLCDLNLSDMSGRHVFEHLQRKRPADISKFAFITGDRSRPETQLFLSSVRRPYLHKPFEPEELLALVATVAPELKQQTKK